MRSRTPSWRRSHRILYWASAGIPVLGVALLLLAVDGYVPVTVTGSGLALNAPCMGLGLCGYVGSVTLPAGPNVIVRWAAVNGSLSSFFVGPPDGGAFSPPACDGSGPTGWCEFTSEGGSYTLHAIQSESYYTSGGPTTLVDFSVTYYRSLW